MSLYFVNRDDFLALFESSNYPPKTAEKSQQRPPGSRPAWVRDLCSYMQ